MAALSFSNNGRSTLASGISDVATSVTVQTGHGARFPASNFKVTLAEQSPATGWEVCLCTSRTGDVLTITRAQEGTTGIAFAPGDYIGCHVTAEALDGFVQGPASATDSSLARFDGTTGKLLKDGAVIGTDVQAYAGAIMSTPGGRLTLSSATPVMTSDVSNSTSIYYTPYIHDKVPIYDGTGWIITTFTELTNTTTDNTVNPAAVAADSNYDLFVWSGSGTIRLGRGPAWTSDTARGTGAGTTELERVNGIWMNKIAITNGPAAQRGTYVGTVRSDASSTIDWELGGIGAGGDAIFLNVWNMYNRVTVAAASGDNTDSWTTATNAFTALNNGVSSGTLNRASFVRGMNEELVNCALYVPGAIATSNSNAGTGIGLDSTSASSAQAMNGGTFSTTFVIPWHSIYTGFPGLGFHYLQALQHGGPSGNTVTFYGDAATTFIQESLNIMELR